MSILATAPPAAPLTLLSTNPAFFMDAALNSKDPCMLTIPASSKLELNLLNVTVTGLVKPGQEGDVSIGLYCYVNGSKTPPPTADPSQGWIVLGMTDPEDVGAVGDPVETQFMFQGSNLMFNFSSGKLQGTFQSNIASSPVAPVRLQNPVYGLIDISPVVWFAVAAHFTPTADTGAHAELTLASFNLTGDF
jgi:hypothetical protein